MTDRSSLYGIAAELLAKSAAILAALPAGAPSKQYVVHGPPAYDCCDMLTVHADSIRYGPYQRSAQGSVIPDPKMHVVPMVPLVVTVLRCASAQPQGGVVITLPQASEIAADAAMVYQDGWALFSGLYTAFRNGSLFTPSDGRAGWPCRAMQVDPALPVSPQGGCLGWLVNVQVQLDGFDPAGA